MGLDGVELVLRCEEFFAISIPDAEAAAVRTVRDLHHLICRHLDVTPSAHLPVIPDPPVIATWETRFRIFRANHQKLPTPALHVKNSPGTPSGEPSSPSSPTSSASTPKTSSPKPISSATSASTDRPRNPRRPPPRTLPSANQDFTRKHWHPSPPAPPNAPQSPRLSPSEPGLCAKVGGTPRPKTRSPKSYDPTSRKSHPDDVFVACATPPARLASH